MSNPRGYDDELISAYLDGEIGPDEAARIERDPQAQARAAELAAVQAAMAEPVPPLASADRDRLRAAAVAAAAPTATVRPIAAARGRRSRAFVPLAAAAGIVAVVLGAMAVLRNLDDGSGDSADWSVASAPATAQSASDASAGDIAPADMAEDAEVETAAEPEPESAGSAFDDDMAEDAEADDVTAPAAEDSLEEAMTDDEAAAEIPAATTTLPSAAPETDDADQSGPGPTDLGSFAGLEQLIDELALRLTDDDGFTGPYTEPGLCAEAVAERVAELSAEVVGEARAELEDGAEADPVGAVDLTVVTIGDEGPSVVYAVAPTCTVEVAALK